MDLFMNFSLGLVGGFFMVPVSSGSATKVAEAAKSMNSSSTMIWIGANGNGIPRMIGKRKMETKATLQASSSVRLCVGCRRVCVPL